MFQTKRKLKRDVAELKEKLRKCNNLQTPDLKPCKDMYCIMCDRCVMPDDRFPIVMLGCKIGAKCANFSPNAIYKQLSNNCAFCKHSVSMPIGGGEYVRVCKKKIGCDEFTPADV